MHIPKYRKQIEIPVFWRSPSILKNIEQSCYKSSLVTDPGAPIVRTSTPLPTTLLLFLETTNRARISQWTVEYRIEGISNSTNVTRSPDEQYYVLRYLHEMNLLICICNYSLILTYIFYIQFAWITT